MPGGDYRDALRSAPAGCPRPGRCSTPTGRGSGSTAGRPAYTVGQRQGLGVALGEPRYVSRIDPLTNTIQLGRREDLETTDHRARTVDASSPGRTGRSRAVPGRRPDPPPRDADPGDRASATPDEPSRGGAGWSRPTRRSGPPRRARRPCSTTATWSSAAAGSPGRRLPDGRLRVARPQRLAGPVGRRAMSIDPALILSVLVGIFHASLYVLIRGNAGGRLPLIVVAAILGAWAGDALADRLGLDVLTIGDFHLLGASIVAWVGIAVSTAVAILGPSERRA